MKIRAALLVIGYSVLVLGRASAPTIALDHVVLAVNDLDATAAKFRSFGFALKPGQPHANGIRNQHVKFKDGTELELLTAPAAKDDLTTRYRQHLAQGDGPAYLALMVRGGPAPAEKPPYIFFGGRNASPTDRPEHFAHTNTAESLVAVWLAADDFTGEKALLSRHGATITPGRRQVNGFAAEVVRLADGGEIYLLPARARLTPDRPIVGVTFRVKDPASATLLAPARTGGLWIELAVKRP